MARPTYAKAKGRRESGSFTTLPHVLLRHEKFAHLSPRATKLLFDLVAQYRGKNNGDFEATFKSMRKRGWRSKSQLAKAVRELIDKGFIVTTRQGGIHRCSLYAVTFFAIDECDEKLEVASTPSPPGDWRK